MIDFLEFNDPVGREYVGTPVAQPLYYTIESRHPNITIGHSSGYTVAINGVEMGRMVGEPTISYRRRGT